MISIRHGLNGILDFDIVNGQEFSKSREVFSAVMIDLKRQGLGGIEHHPPLDERDFEKLSAYFNVFNPDSLQEKVFVDVLLYFGRRGRENLRELRVSDFSCKKDSDGILYIYIKKDELTKNHKEDTNTADGRMYEIKECPVKTFVRYKRMLPFGCDYLFPGCRKTPSKDGCYFDNAPMGHNKLGKMMTSLSEKAGLSKKYTNHSLRATSVHLLDSAQIPTRHIMSVTGHKAEASLKTYTGYTSEATKRCMSDTISESTGIAKIKGRKTTATCTSSTSVSSRETLTEDNLSGQVDLGECAFTPLSNSQIQNVMSDFDNDGIDALLHDIPLPKDATCNNQKYTLNVINTSSMALQPYIIPTINAQNVVINYNIYPGSNM